MEARSSPEHFKFGSGKIYPTKRKVNIPVRLVSKDGKEILFKFPTCIVDAEIPFLLGLDLQKKLKMVTDVDDEELKMKQTGDKFKLKSTPGCHFLLEFAKLCVCFQRLNP